MSRSLDETPLSLIYTIPLCETDAQLVGVFNVGIVVVIFAIIGWHGLVGSAPYGKSAWEVTKPLSLIWCYPINARFTWMFGHLPTIVIPWVVILYSPAKYMYNFANLSVFILFYVHCFYRTVLYPIQISRNATPTPVWFLCSIFGMTVIHIFVETHHMVNILQLESFSMTAVIGIPIGLLGGWINWRHDFALTQLRNEGKGYQIPRGGLFEIVSCPNYLGELLKWWGTALMTSFGSVQVMFAIYCTIFLGLRANFTHNWYKSTFGHSYPSTRRAMIPGLF